MELLKISKPPDLVYEVEIAGQCLKRIGGVYTCIIYHNLMVLEIYQRLSKTVRQFISLRGFVPDIATKKKHLMTWHQNTWKHHQVFNPSHTQDRPIVLYKLPQHVSSSLPSSSNPHCPCLPATAPISGDHPGSDW